MKNNEFVGWYQLSKEKRDEIVSNGTEFEDLRHSGTWNKDGIRIFMDGILPTISFRTSAIDYDMAMPKFHKLMDRGFRIHITPVEFHTLQVNFILPKMEKTNEEKKEPDRYNPIDVDRICY